METLKDIIERINEDQCGFLTFHDCGQNAWMRQF